MKSINWSFRNKLSPSFILRICVGAIVSVIILSGIGYYFFAVDFNNYLPPFSISLFHNITGIPGPGCGMTRAMLHLGQLRFSEAFELNPFSLPLLLVMIYYLVLARVPHFLRVRKVLIILLALVVIVWILRIIN